MAALMFPVADVVDRLKAKVPLASSVGIAADLETALEAEPKGSAVLYVVSLDRGGPIKYTGNDVTIQDCTTQVIVVLLVRHVGGEATGSGVRRRVDALVMQIRAALIGWTPGDAFDGLSFLAARDDSYRAGWYAGQQAFNTGFRIHNEVTP